MLCIVAYIDAVVNLYIISVFKMVPMIWDLVCIFIHIVNVLKLITSIYSLIVYFVSVFLWFCNSIIPICAPFIHRFYGDHQVSGNNNRLEYYVIAHSRDEAIAAHLEHSRN